MKLECWRTVRCLHKQAEGFVDRFVWEQIKELRAMGFSALSYVYFCVDENSLVNNSNCSAGMECSYDENLLFAGSKLDVV